MEFAAITFSGLLEAFLLSPIKKPNITPMQKKRLLPFLKGQTRESHDYIFWEHEGSEEVWHGKWKLVTKSGGTWEFLDMEKDQSEL